MDEVRTSEHPSAWSNVHASETNEEPAQVRDRDPVGERHALHRHVTRDTRVSGVEVQPGYAPNMSEWVPILHSNQKPSRVSPIFFAASVTQAPKNSTWSCSKRLLGIEIEIAATGRRDELVTAAATALTPGRQERALTA
jgi:hypothetical protein